MSVDLMFFDCLNSQNKEQQTSKPDTPLYTQQDRIDYAIPDGKIQASSKFKLKNIAVPMHQYVPVVFEDQNFC